MDFSFLESFFGDPVVIQGMLIPGIFISFLLLLFFYLLTDSSLQDTIKSFLIDNKAASFTLIIFISIVLGSANMYVSMFALQKFHNKPHPFLYYLTHHSKYQDYTDKYSSFKSDSCFIDTLKMEHNKHIKKFSVDSLNTILKKRNFPIYENELLFFYLNSNDTVLTEELYDYYKSSGKATFDWIKEKIILLKPDYKKRIIILEAKTNLFAGLITPCLICLLIIYSRRKSKWKYVKKIEKLSKHLARLLRPEFLIVSLILIINYLQFIKNIEKAEPNSIYTSYYNLTLEENKDKQK